MKLHKPSSFLLYRYLLFPFALGLVKLIAIFTRGKLHDMVQGKAKEEFVFNTSSEKFKKKDPIWFHAASGEIEYARPLIRSLKKQFPEIPLLVTYSSPSAKKILSSIPEIDVWGPLPWDTPWACHKFLLRFRPRVCLWSRTDVWPEMSYQLKKFGIPSVLFAATFAKNSTRLNGLGKSISAFALSNLDQIFCVSDEDQTQLKDSTGLDSEVLGDTRFEQVVHRLQNPKTLRISQRPTSRCIVFGSTWPEDEKIILDSLSLLRSENKLTDAFKIVLAPHEIHTDHVEKLQSRLTEIGLSFQSYSDPHRSALTADLLIVDQVGILAELYTWADLAFVGGSFKKLVHSVMEPLAAGARVMVGPYYHNNREALRFSQDTLAKPPPVTVIENAQQMKVEIEAVLGQSPESLEQTRVSIQKLIESQTGTSEKLVHFLRESHLV